MTHKTQPEADHPLSFSELMSLSLAFNGRIDALWQRVLYTHAAIVGVMVFFATTEHEYFIPRILVFFFYTLNMGITIGAFSESYAGLRAVLGDLKSRSQRETRSQTEKWVLAHAHEHRVLRLLIGLGVVWLVLGYLLFYPYIGA